MRSMFTKVLILMIAGMLFSSGVVLADTTDKLNVRIKQSRLIFDEMKDMPDTGIPQDLLNKCHGIAIFPNVLKGAFGIGGQYGQGILLNKVNGTWSAPVFLSIGGASFGFQIGGQATDMILVIMNERGVDSLSHGNLTLGGDASVAAGPVGRDAQMATDATLQASIFSYSRNKGLFAGISLKGAVVGPMKNLNKDYYGEDVSARDILSGKVAAGEEAQKLIDLLNKY